MDVNQIIDSVSAALDLLLAFAQVNELLKAVS